MAFDLTSVTRDLSRNQNKQVNIILEIDGIPTIFSAQDIGQLARIGMDGLLIGNFVIGGLFTPDNNKDLLSIKDGTTTTITQQIQADKGAASSISTMRLALVDKDDFVSQELASGNHIEDILSREAQVYLALQGGSHPEDSIRIFQGNITNFDTSAGLVLLTVSAPDNLKRQTLLPQVSTELTAGIDAVVTSIPVTSTQNFVVSQDSLTSYIQIDDEIIEVGTITDTSYDGCIRGQLGTNIAAHDDEAETLSFYRLRGQPLELLLKLYLSGEKLFNKTEPIIRIEGARVFFNSYDVENVYGLSLNDFVEVSGLVSGKRIIGFGVGNGESYIDVEDLDFDEPLQVGRYADFTSKYDALNFGAGLSTSQVDIEQHEKINDLFGSSFPEMDIYIRDTLELRDLIEKDILYPIGGVSLKRKGRISLSYTSPPLSELNTLTITAADIISPEKITVTRGSNRKMYNTVEYVYDTFTLEEKFQRNNIIFDSDSFNRIRAGGKRLKIEANGFRKSASNFIDTQSRRYLDKYRLGAETLKVELTWGAGFSVEAGDIVIFDATGLGIYDSETKSRTESKPKLMEVTNVSIAATSGRVNVELTSTALSLNFRYGVIAPSSIIDTGSSTTAVKIATSFASDEGFEYLKWESLVGSSLRIHSNDFTFDETVTLTGFSPTNNNEMLIDPPLSIAPSAGYIVDSPSYQDASDTQKLVYCSFCPQVPVVSGASGLTFTVDDGSKFYVDSEISVHNSDFSSVAENVIVTDVTGNVITVDTDLGFTPDNTYLVDLIGFSDDNGKAYALI